MGTKNDFFFVELCYSYKIPFLLTLGTFFFVSSFIRENKDEIAKVSIVRLDGVAST